MCWIGYELARLTIYFPGMLKRVGYVLEMCWRCNMYANMDVLDTNGMCWIEKQHQHACVGSPVNDVLEMRWIDEIDVLEMCWKCVGSSHVLVPCVAL